MRALWLSHGVPRPGLCGGMALPLSLAYLLVLAVLGAVLVEIAGLQFRMAGNHEARAVAEQDARAIAHELTGAVDASLQLPPGYLLCGVDDARVDCDERRLARPRLLDEMGRDDALYSIRRGHPQNLYMAAGRELQGRASSAAHERFALYEIEVAVIPGAAHPGSARTVRGLAVRSPSEPGQ